MLDLVKYDWQNGLGTWIRFHEWMTVPSETTDERASYPSTVAPMRVYASSGKGQMLDFEIIERLPLPEDLRTTGRSSVLLSQVILYEEGRNMNGDELIAAMRKRRDES